MENLSILHARDLIARRCSDLHEYPLHRSDAEDIGMVCGGDVTALFTFIPGTDAAWAALAADLLQHIADRRPGYLALPLDGTVGFLTDDPEKEGSFTMPLSIGERAILFGAGHCSLALTPVLRSVGFRVTVFDDRPDLITPERFPAAERLICGDFSHIDRYLSCSAEDYIVVMTSGHTLTLSSRNRFSAETSPMWASSAPGLNRLRQCPPPGRRSPGDRHSQCSHPRGHSHQGRHPGGDRPSPSPAK